MAEGLRAPFEAESYAGGSLATGRSKLRGQMKGVSQGRGGSLGFTNPPRGENPKAKSRVLSANHPHTRNLND
jgi:hypothetical protein